MHRVPHPSTCFPTDSDFCFLFLSEDLLEMLDGVDVFFKMDVNSQLLTPQMSRRYSPIHEFEGKQLTVDSLDKPEDFYMHNRRYSASVIM